MELSDQEKFYYLNLESGYEGEIEFDALAAEFLQEERYVINDLLLEINNSSFQIDSVVISQGVIYLIDIKNNHGNWYFEDDKFYLATTGRDYKNPVSQLKRCQTLFNQLLRNLKHSYLVEAYIIYVNPEFTLYKAQLDLPIILPTQVKSFLRDLNKIPSKLSEGHKKLAQELLGLHKTKKTFTNLPNYEFEQLQKGVCCKNCDSFLIKVKHNYIICGNCGEQEALSHAILRTVKEFKLLFPDRRMTTQSMFEWCNLDVSKKTIFRVLKKNYTLVGSNKWAYFK